MANRKDLLGNELMKEIAGIRIDTLWNMLALRRAGRLPPVDAEKATGDLDDKGGLFLPGGLVFQDWENKPIEYEAYEERSPEAFRSMVRSAMRYDGATLFDHDGVATRVKLSNTAFSRIASSLLESKQEALRRGTTLGERRPARIGSEDISRSYCPNYIPAPYGARTALSSDASVCLTEPRMFYRALEDYYGLRGAEADKAWSGIKSSRQAVLGEDDVVLAPPFMVTCHNTRYREPILTGLTRISGFGRFGEFATFTLEVASAELLHEVEGDWTELAPEELVADHDGIQVAAVLRTYPRTNPGARLLKGVSTTILAVERDLGLDLDAVTAEARRRYKI